MDTFKETVMDSQWVGQHIYIYNPYTYATLTVDSQKAASTVCEETGRRGSLQPLQPSQLERDITQQ